MVSSVAALGISRLQTSRLQVNSRIDFLLLRIEGKYCKYLNLMGIQNTSETCDISKDLFRRAEK
jgi:hypothetical protein